MKAIKLHQQGAVMYNLNFNSIKEFESLNKKSEAETVYLLKQFLSNQNYRAQYNKKKSELLKSPEVKALLKKLA